MSANVFICGFERQALTDYFDTVDTPLFRDLVVVRSGQASMRIQAQGVVNTRAIKDLFLTASPPNPIRRIAAVFYIRINDLPTIDTVIWNDGGMALLIDASGVLSYGTQVGTTVITALSFHKIEIIHDQEFNGPGSGQGMFRLDGVLEGTPDTTNGGAIIERIQLGNTAVKGQTSEGNVVFWYDDLYVWYSDEKYQTTQSGGTGSDRQPRRAPWINDKVCEVEPDAIGIPHASRVPIAIGALNDFTGVGDTTNKYLNVDEDPSNGDTDYNQGGASSSNQKQLFTFTSRASYPDTIRGFSVHSKKSLSAYPVTTGYDLVLDSDGNIHERPLTNDQIAGAGVYFPHHIGYPTKLNGDVLDAAYLNTLQGGHSIRDASVSMRESAVWLAVATGAAFTNNDVAFHDKERNQVARY